MKKDNKRRYAYIQNSYDDLISKIDTSRYSKLLKICNEVATNETKSEDNSLDMTPKLRVINLFFTITKPQPILGVLSNEDIDVETGSSLKV